jgi:hypothetical protein
MIREGIIGKTIESRRLIRADTTRGTKAKRDNP